MKSSYFLSILSLIILFGSFHFSCEQKTWEKKKIVYINSYHRGHPSSDEIMDAVIGYFPADSFEVFSYIMDTKRNPEISYIQHKASQLYDSVQLVEPDALIVSDDNAVKYIVTPNIEELSMPVVFCGVNGSDREYQLPANKVTGMLEVLPVIETISSIRTYYPTMKNLLVLTENTTTSRKEKALMDSMYHKIGIHANYELVDDFDSWKTAFIKANDTYDIIYLVTHGAIKNWSSDEAKRTVAEYISIPVITCEDFMMPYAVFGLTKVASEQGIWAASTAKSILNGNSLSDFPVIKNKLSVAWLNTQLAEKIEFHPDTAAFQNFRIFQEE